MVFCTRPKRPFPWPVRSESGWSPRGKNDHRNPGQPVESALKCDSTLHPSIPGIMISSIMTSGFSFSAMSDPFQAVQSRSWYVHAFVRCSSRAVVLRISVSSSIINIFFLPIVKFLSIMASTAALSNHFRIDSILLSTWKYFHTVHKVIPEIKSDKTLVLICR
jgi:hypothetical protein